MGKEQQEKAGFWSRYKYLIIGVVGALLLMSSLRVQSIVVYYETDEGEKYAVTMDYSAFGSCIRCYPTENADKIVEKAIFFGAGKQESVLRAAEGLFEIAEKKEGSFQVQANGFLGDTEAVTDEMVKMLAEKGYDVSKVQE